jgi:hypothetical protein
VTVQLIELADEFLGAQPSIKLAETALGSIWQYTGLSLTDIGCSPGSRSEQDLNRATERAAQVLQQKVSSRNIDVELIIDPLIPPLGIENGRILPIVSAIAENASASVEPGPGTVTLSTWWEDRYAGVDAIGQGGILPYEIRENLMRPGFTTRVAEWDTGFGLHAAMEAAAAIAARIELMEPDEAVCFRLAIPLKRGTPLSPPEISVGLIGEGMGSSVRAGASEDPALNYQLLASLRGSEDDHAGIIQA